MLFRAKLIIGVCLVQVVSLLVLLASTINTLSSIEARMVEDRAATYIDLVNQASVGAIAALDLAALEELASQMISKPDILFVAIKNLDDIILVSASQRRDTNINSFTWYAKGEHEPELGAPLSVWANIESAGLAFGRVYLAYDTGAAAHEVSAARNEFLILATLQLLLTLAFSAFLAYGLNKQFGAIKEGIAEFAARNFKFKIPVFNKDETGNIAAFMNDMAADLRSMYGDLENRVAHRTKQLEAANQKLNVTVSELEETRGELIEKEKMASLAGLVAGIAHEVNTPIGVCVTAASYFVDAVNTVKAQYDRGELTQDDFLKALGDMQENSNLILRNAMRATDLVKSFKQVAVDQTSHEMREFELGSYMCDVVNTLTPEIKKLGVKVATDCEDDIRIESYPGAVSQVVTNLIQNSMKHGFNGIENGKIDISTDTNGDQAMICVEDNGVGMSEEVRAQIFDPFFTTARGDGGSGLGLHIVHNLVTQVLGGKIKCTDGKDNGTLFIIKFPLKLKLSQQQVEAKSEKLALQT